MATAAERKAFYFDLLERAGWTFVQGFSAAFVVHGQHFDEHTMGIGALAGAISVAKSLIATKLPWAKGDTASTLPEAVDPAKVAEEEAAAAKKTTRKRKG